ESSEWDLQQRSRETSDRNDSGVISWDRRAERRALLIEEETDDAYESVGSSNGISETGADCHSDCRARRRAQCIDSPFLFVPGF
ncbi:hypothetical protein PENTCL1PPCAC_9589, partial [Pristionchus entomophagus]